MKDLPKKIFNFKSSDKSFHQRYEDTTAKDYGNFVSPFVCIICNGRNVGKTRVAKNIIVHKNPPYEKIVVYSPMAETTEYTDDIECEMINDINDVYGKFDRNERNLFVLDDLDAKSLPKKDQRILSNFLRFESSHNQIDIILINQQIYDLMPICRRIADYIILFSVGDADFMRSLAKRFNIELDIFKYIFKHYITDKYSSLLIDERGPPEVRFRKNIFNVITIK